MREINAVSKEVKRVKHEEKQKTQGDIVVKWIFGGLIVLAIIFTIWSMYVV